jgi:hypothetical protein
MRGGHRARRLGEIGTNYGIDLRQGGRLTADGVTIQEDGHFTL